MNSFAAEALKEKLKKEKSNTVTFDINIYNKIYNDRMDFGFDSIYFRYAAKVDELTMAKIAANPENSKHIQNLASADKMHFYHALEQLTNAHHTFPEDRYE